MLYSLNKHQFIFSRDVKFFESIFPFKESVSNTDASENVLQGLNHVNFFDVETPELPHDDESSLIVIVNHKVKVAALPHLAEFLLLNKSVIMFLPIGMRWLLHLKKIKFMRAI